jgi:hypothetical protein
VLRQLAELDRMGLEALVERWRILMGTEPRHNNRIYLVKRLAYRIQELAFGGLTQDDRERMDRVLDAEGYDELGLKREAPKRRSKGVGARFIPGTILVREWGGDRHEVRVLESGFEYRGMPYRSLSALARLITGTSWNGPAFFGLRDANRGDGHGKK